MPDPTADLVTALQAAQFALVEAADHIRSREGWSPAYRRALKAINAAREELIKLRRATNA